jgi:hypothetical protein
MTREEERRQASIEYTCKNRPICIGGGAFSEVIDEMNRNHTFEGGAKWADETMIEKACQWFENYLFDLGYPDDWCRDSPNIESGKERFIKAMKGE